METFLELGMIPCEFTGRRLRKVRASGNVSYFSRKFDAFVRRLPEAYHRAGLLVGSDGIKVRMGNGLLEPTYRYCFQFNEQFYRGVIEAKVEEGLEYELYETCVCRNVRAGLVRLQIAPTHDVSLVEHIIELAMRDFLFANVAWDEEEDDMQDIMPYLFEIEKNKGVVGKAHEIMQWINGQRDVAKPLDLPCYCAPRPKMEKAVYLGFVVGEDARVRSGQA